MKRILIFSTAYYPFVGGAEVAMKEITDRLTDGYHFDMITALMDKKLPRQEKIGNINVYRFGIGNPAIDKLLLALKGQYLAFKLHRKNNYQAVWSLMASYGAFPAVKFKKKTKVKFLLTLQEGDPIEYILKKVRFIKKRFNEIFTAADGLQPISNYLLKWGQDMGFKGEIAEVVPNGVDIDNFTAAVSENEIQRLRKTLGFPEGSTIIITSSRLVVKNGIADVIKALKYLPKNFCFYILGDGPLGAPLKQLVKEMGLEKRVVFGGYKDHRELPKYLKAADVFIRPSLSEGLGNSFLEAMAAGLPTIGTLVGGIPDFLTDGKTGFVCRPNDPQDIAKAVSNAASLEQTEKQKLWQNAMELINTKYNWDYISSRMKNFFNVLIK